MERARHQFLAGSGFTQDQDRTGTGGDGRQNFEQSLHQGAATGKITHQKFPLQFLAQGFKLGEVAKGFGPAHYPSLCVPQHGGRDADGDAVAVRVDDVARFSDHRFTGLDCLLQTALRSAHAGAKHLTTAPADRFLARNTGNLLGRPVKRGDHPLHVNRENTVRDAFQD